ncbi:PREDICTED: dnaJ homolog subfamily C member 25 homolog [Papilio polytes]|uniref:dnaJ homolog subfamily C member 25 homolog n=1 Tax=Papilio polytes TaxID=76194 RepID=UPI0006763CF1|nr:PREDICTED: dnaJ homolog subfamily C member 25 homolog [Papilio polytes]
MLLYHGRLIVLSVICQVIAVYSADHLLEGIYCGKKNCYEVLGISREATKNEIGRSYRQLAKKFHPDMHRSPDAKKEAEEKFKEIATAYEILRDDEERSDYDYMLDNPQEYYAHYYRYYRRRMAPKVDVRIVIAVTITVISVIQYYSAWSKYDTAIKYFMTVPKYRNRALEIAKAESKEAHAKGKATRKSKAEQKMEQDRVIRRVIEENLDIRGAYAKPQIVDILWIQLILLPYTISYYAYWYLRWFWKFTIMKLPYGEEEKLYIIRKYMKLGQHQFNALEDEERHQFLEEELWIKDNFKVWKQIKDEEAKKALAENNKYKQYRRYIKQHGVGRMTFDDS